MNLNYTLFETLPKIPNYYQLLIHLQTHNATKT